MTSPLRQEHAQLTRRRVMDAAYTLLLDGGYAGTTVTAVARRAGVAVPTVYKAFGSKPALVKQVYDRVLAGDDDAVPIGERVTARRLLAERDPRRAITLYAVLVTDLATRTGPLLAVLLGAQSTDAHLDEFVATIERERREGNERFAAHLASTGGLAVAEDRAVDLLWLFTAPDVHHRLVTQRRWHRDAFAAWLTETLHTQLLGAGADPGGQGAARASSTLA
ncbi:TetR/AcrR family transcriptional regulator [Dactylosporangium sp. NPDC049525]|uniref:TetR/AcrR family transcriptional regulator n=1 Tax=Dactylosporangium sp. NPDC049525 TaxID=3154730 RepID=UPI00343C2CDA